MSTLSSEDGSDLFFLFFFSYISVSCMYSPYPSISWDKAIRSTFPIHPQNSSENAMHSDSRELTIIEEDQHLFTELAQLP